MSDVGRSERKPIDSTDDKDAAEPIEKNQEGLHRSKSDIDSSRDGYDVGSEPTDPCDESELGFAPSIELRGKLDRNVSGSSGKPRFGFAPEIDLAARRDRNASGPSGKPRFGFAREMDLATKRDEPPTLAPPKRGNRVAQSDPPLLPYEAAQLAASTPPLRQPRLSGKLVPICLAVIIATASAVSAAIILSVDDDGLIPAKAGASVGDRGATTTNLLDKDLKREVQAPKLDNLTSSAQRTAPIIHSLGQSMVSDHREPLPESPVTSPPVGSPNLAAVTSVPKSERDGLKDRIEASLKTGRSPTNLAAAASWRSTTAMQDRKQQIDAGFNREEIDHPALRDENAAPRPELPPTPASTSSTISAAVSTSPIDDRSRASADGMLTNDQDAETGQSADLAKASVRSRGQPRSDDQHVDKDAQDDDVSAHRNAAFAAHQTLKEIANRSEAPITARPPMLMAGDRNMNGAGLRQVESLGNAKTAHLEDMVRARPQHKPELKPLDVAALLPPAEVTTSFRPAFKPTETNLSKLPGAVLIASSDAIDRAEQTPMLELLWRKVVHGVAEAFRNRDTTFQVASRADPGGRGSDEDRGGGNGGGGSGSGGNGGGGSNDDDDDDDD